MGDHGRILLHGLDWSDGNGKKKGGGQILKLMRAPSSTALSNVFSFVLLIKNLIPCVGHRGGEMRYGRSTGTRSGVSKLKLFPDLFYPFGTT